MSEAEGDRIRTFLMYAQESRGMGHTTRTLTIARLVCTITPAFDGAARLADYIAQVLEGNHTDDQRSVEGPWLVGQRA